MAELTTVKIDVRGIDEVKEILAEAKEAMLKQKAMNPVGVEIDKNGSAEIWYCPGCNAKHSVIEDGWRQKYCDWCGQHIEWSGCE